MGDGNWWDRKLGGGQRPAAQPHSYPERRPAPPQAQVIQNPYRNYGEQYEERPAGYQDIGIEEAVAMGESYRPKPGKAKALGEGNCPECGSNNFFSRRNTMMRGPAPAPICEDCGYNGGLFEQTGTALNGIGAGHGTPVMSARQDQASVQGSFGVPTDRWGTPQYGVQGTYIRG